MNEALNNATEALTQAAANAADATADVAAAAAPVAVGVFKRVAGKAVALVTANPAATAVAVCGTLLVATVAAERIMVLRERRRAEETIERARKETNDANLKAAKAEGRAEAAQEAKAA